MGYAEFGDPSGSVVLWFHGTPGGRRQFPLVGRRAAEKLGLRVVLVERAGSGLSDSHPTSGADWAADMVHVADALGAERLGVVGLSGGGPYALSCAATPRRPVALPPLRCSVASPSVGPDAVAGGASSWPAVRPGAVSPAPALAAATAAAAPFIPLAH